MCNDSEKDRGRLGVLSATIGPSYKQRTLKFQSNPLIFNISIFCRFFVTDALTMSCPYLNRLDTFKGTCINNLQVLKKLIPMTCKCFDIADYYSSKKVKVYTLFEHLKELHVYTWIYAKYMVASNLPMKNLSKKLLSARWILPLWKKKQLQWLTFLRQILY